MDCDKYNGNCHTCVLANCKFEDDVCSDKPDELERGLKSDSDEDDKKKVSEKEALTVAEFMKEGAKCKDVKKLCDYVQESDPLNYDDDAKGKTYLKLKQGKEVPQNYFCIKKVTTENLKYVADSIKNSKYITEPLQQFGMEMNKKFTFPKDKPYFMPLMLNEMAEKNFTHWYQLSWKNDSSFAMPITAKQIADYQESYKSTPIFNSKVFYYGFINIFDIPAINTTANATYTEFKMTIVPSTLHQVMKEAWQSDFAWGLCMTVIFVCPIVICFNCFYKPKQKRDHENEDDYYYGDGEEEPKVVYRGF